jgi:signal transduction histidine kinase
MHRPRASLALIAIALCLIVQGAFLVVAARWPEAPRLPLPYLFAITSLLCSALAARSWLTSERRRVGWILLLAGQLVILVVTGRSLQQAALPDNAREQAARDRIAAAVAVRTSAAAALPDAVEALAGEASALLSANPAAVHIAPSDRERPLPGGGDENGSGAITGPFALLARVQSRWPALRPAADGFPVALALWSGGERLAWDRDMLPFSLPDSIVAGGEAQYVQDTGAGWIWRVFRRVGQDRPGLVLEIQVGLGVRRDADEAGLLAPLEPAGPGGQLDERGLLTLAVVPQAEATGATWSGGLGEGLGFSRGLPLPLVDAAGEPVRLQVNAQGQSERFLAHRRQARDLLALLVAWALAACAWAWSVAGGGGLLAAAWATRGLWVAVDTFRWLQPAWPEQHLPALPWEPLSLVDPAYFATPFLGGWFASAADALLTGLLLAVTVWAVTKHLLARARSGRGRPASLVTGLLFGCAVALVLVGLREVVEQIVANANPRLIGPDVPLRSLTFWTLHGSLLAIGGSLLLLAGLLAARLQAAGARRGCSALVVIGAAVAAALLPAGGPVLRLLLVGVVWAAWLGGRLLRQPDPPLRWLSFLLPLLLAIGWNYALLAASYRATERAWLERKADLLVQPQDEWILFLLENVLAEMSTAQPVVLPAGLPAGRGEELWRDWAAYDLWRHSAVHDLGLSCLVEILDQDRATTSLFATGFLGDFRYEVRERSPWRSVTPAEWSGGPPLAVQRELRRYPAGEELVLRGEVARRDQPGWIRLELPVQSHRISTMLASLGGSTSLTRDGGYRPRAEIDRPVYLARADTTGWLDAGPGGVPSARSYRRIAALRSGEKAWSTIQVEGRSYLVLWRDLPPSVASRPGEGFLLGLQIPSLLSRLLDVSRLLLLDLGMLALFTVALLSGRWLRGGRPELVLGFQERFLAGYLGVGLLLLLLAGVFVDRLNLERLESESRQRTRDGLTAAMAQLQGLLGEQARALAASEYIADLLANRLAGQRPLGPFAARQGMVFAGDGELLLDETLSDLDPDESALLLATARESPLLIMGEESDIYLGIAVPIDLSGLLPEAPPQRADGTFFYRERVGGDLLAGLGEIVQGEVVLRLGGEAVVASHPERVFAGLTPLMMPPPLMQEILRLPAVTSVHQSERTRLSFTGSAALPLLLLGDQEAGGGQRLVQDVLPALLTVGFPAREREFLAQRERTVLFLAGLAGLLLVTAGLLALVLTWNIFGPVRLLVAATRRLAAGDFSAPLPEPRRDEVGTLASSFGAMRDELQRTQAALAERERFLATVLERVSVGVAVLDDEGRVVALNPAGERILREFYGGDEAAAGARRLAHALAEQVGAQQQGGTELRDGGGRRTLRGRIAPLMLDEGRRHQVIVFEDVTEFLETKRLALNAELARQVAHEIKNPLTPIQLSVQLLEQAHRDRHPQLDRILVDTVQQVLQQVSLLRSIAGEFSLLGRPDELDRSPLDLAALVRRVVAGYRPLAAGEPGPGLRVEIAGPDPPPVLGHAESVAKVLGNLMENSLEAKGEPAALVLHIRWRVNEHEVTLVWEDNGPGLPEEVTDRLFDPYFSTKSKGTGLGLAICRSLLARMGGRIDLRNRPGGGGAVAEVTLVRTGEAAAGQEAERDR